MGPLARGKAPPDWDRLAQRSNALLWMEHWKQTETEGGVSARGARGLQGRWEHRPSARATPRGGHGWSPGVQLRHTLYRGHRHRPLSSVAVVWPRFVFHNLKPPKNSSKLVKSLVGENTIIHINFLFLKKFFY